MPLPLFELERYFEAYEHNVRFNLCASGSQSWTVAELIDAGAQTEPDPESARQAFYEQLNGLSLEYPPTRGTDALRESITQLYPGLSLKDIQVHNGSAEALYDVMRQWLTPEDHVIVHFPSYPSLWKLPQAMGCTVDFWNADEANGWQLSVEALDALITPRTKAIIVNFPHNPTGTVMSQESWAALFRLAEAKGIWILSDEVYRWGEYNPEDRLPAACQMSPLGISIGSLSKACGLAGLRIGWLACQSNALHEQAASARDYTSISPSAPSLLLGQWALQYFSVLIERNRTIALKNLEALETTLSPLSSQIQWVRPQAGAVMYPRLVDQSSSEVFCQTFLEQTGGLLLPSIYYHHGNRRFRLGFGSRTFLTHLPTLAAFLNHSILHNSVGRRYSV